VENVAFSPLSVSAALSTLLVGSWGDTLAQLRNGLGYPKEESLPEAAIHSAYKTSLESLLRPGRGVEINYANTIFGSAGLSVILYFYQVRAHANLI
jgi:serine protease inhibitor